MCPVYSQKKNFLPEIKYLNEHGPLWPLPLEEEVALTSQVHRCVHPSMLLQFFFFVVGEHPVWKEFLFSNNATLFDYQEPK